MSEQQWFYESNGQQVGPVKWDNLMSDLKAGLVTQETLVWAGHLPEWTPLGQCMVETPQAALPAVVPSSEASPRPDQPTTLTTTQAGKASAVSKPKRRSKLLVVVLAVPLLGIVTAIVVPAILGQRERARQLQALNNGGGTPSVQSPDPAGGVSSSDLKPTAKVSVNLVEFCRAYNGALNQQVERYKAIYDAHINPQEDQSAISVLPDLIGSALNPYKSVDTEGFMTLYPGNRNYFRVTAKLVDQKIERIVFDCNDEMIRPGGAPGRDHQLTVFTDAVFGSTDSASYNLLCWLPEWDSADETNRGYILKQDDIVSGKLPYKGGSSCLYKGVLITGTFIDPAKPKGERGIRYTFQFAI